MVTGFEAVSERDVRPSALARPVGCWVMISVDAPAASTENRGVRELGNTKRRRDRGDAFPEGRPWRTTQRLNSLPPLKFAEKVIEVSRGRLLIAFQTQ